MLQSYRNVTRKGDIMGDICSTNSTVFPMKGAIPSIPLLYIIGKLVIR